MAGPNGILFSPNQTSDCLRDVMREISMHEISFRSVSPRDMDSLEKWYSMTDELGYATGFKSLEEERERIMSHPMISMMIILGDDQAVGFICCELRILDERKVVWIHIIIVDPVFQNRGIGTWAVRRLLNNFESRGASVAMASVSEENKCGLRFWESLGFERFPTMEKALNNSGTSGVAIMKRNLT